MRVLSRKREMLLWKNERGIILIISNRTFINNKVSFYWPRKPCKIFLLPPQNTRGCTVVPLKYTRDKPHNQANKSQLRTAYSWAKCQRCHILIPHGTDLSYLAGSSPSFHRVSYFGLISATVLSHSSCTNPSWLCCPLQTPLSASFGSSFLPAWSPPVNSC